MTRRIVLAGAAIALGVGVVGAYAAYTRDLLLAVEQPEIRRHVLQHIR